MSTTTMEVKLKGLTCANCAAKIEHKLNNLQLVDEAVVNVLQQEAKIRLNKPAEETDLLMQIEKVVHYYEPDVIVLNKEERERQKVFMLNGLSCANCADKIERKLNTLPEVLEVSVSAIHEGAKITLADSADDSLFLKALEQIVHEYEPDVTVMPKKGGRQSLEPPRVRDALKKVALPFGTGMALYLIGFLVPLDPVFRFGVFFAAYLFFGYDVLKRSINNIRKGEIFDENFLMSLATIGAFAIGEYPEAVAVMLFYQIGEFFQDLAVSRSRSSIMSLVDLKPEFARVIRDNTYIEIPPEDVNAGDQLLVRPGEKVPLDGIIADGASQVDTSAITGEPVPAFARKGDVVLSGSINMTGVIRIEVTKPYHESTVAKIMDLVENASSRKAPAEQFITKFARVYTPIVVIAALMLAFVPPMVTSFGDFGLWLHRALVFLVISCPCALVVSVPLTFFSGIGEASKEGVLIKGANYLQALNDAKTVVLDKTGTLTKGNFIVSQVYADEGIKEEEVLQYAAWAEAMSNHPIAKSVIAAYGKAVDTLSVEQYEEIGGMGIAAKVNGKEILAGNSRLMEKYNIPYQESSEIGTVVHVAVGKTYFGYLIITDEIKKDSREAVLMLRQAGIDKTVMLTGDKRETAEQVAELVGLDEVYAELLPDGKVLQLERLMESRGGKVIAAGDGVNDAPLLMRSDIGIAMGGLGSDAAIEAADIVLMTDEPKKIAVAIQIAKATNRLLWQNIAFIIAIKVLFLVLGALGIVNMWMAVFADVGVALLAVLNAMRKKR